MKTLAIHNSEVKATKASESYKAGVVCDVCGQELMYINPNVIMTSMPPKQSVSCNNEQCKDFNKIKYKVI